MKRLSLLCLVLFGAALAFLSPASPASAHPLGNFSVNTAAAIHLYADAIHVGYVVDMAEIPTLQERAAIDTDGDGNLSPAELDAYLAATATALITGLEIAIAGEPLPLESRSHTIALRPGEAGLDILRIEIALSAEVSSAGPTTVSFGDSNYEGRAGYHEVVVSAAPGVSLSSSSAPSSSPTGLLTVYDGTVAAAGGNRAAQFTYTPGFGAPAPGPVLSSPRAAVVQPRPSTTGLLARFLETDRLTLATIAVMLAIALAFGAVHALEPGHGKSIVAAYFVGTHGSACQAAVLGLIVALTHSLGVFIIAALVLFGSRFILPETLYPWLTLVSGLMVLGLGGMLLLSRVRSSDSWHRLQHRHHHAHEHNPEYPQAHAGAVSRRPPWKALIALGLVDGMVPTPSTLVVLLGAISLDRIELGMLLVVAFSTGMALVMAGISLAVLVANAAARRLHRRLGAGGPPARILARVVPAFPAIAALVLLAVGSTIVVRGLSQVAAL